MGGLLSKLGKGLRSPWAPSGERRPASDALAWLALAVELLALAAALVALAATYRDSLALSFIWIGVAATFLLAAAILVIRAVKAIPEVRKSGGRGLYDYRQRVGDLTFIDEVVSEGQRAIGPAHPDKDVLVRRLVENSGVLRTFSRERGDGRVKFCGYYLLYPLIERAAEEIMAGEVRSAAELGTGALCESFAEAEYIYIAMVLGTDEHASPHVTDMLRRELAGILAAGNVKQVFARPATPKGGGLMKRYGFLPIGDEDDVWSLPGARLKAQLLVEMSPTVIFIPDPESVPGPTKDPLD